MKRKNSRTIFEKIFKPKNTKILVLNIFQVSAYILSICGLIYYVNGIIQKYLFDPNIGISESHKQVHEIPFPAVTICSPVVLKSDLVNLREFIKIHDTQDIIKNLSINEQNYIAAKAQVCLYNHLKVFNKGTPNRTERNVVKLLREGALSVKETFSLCVMNNLYAPCIATRSLTDVGLCYTFNIQSHDTIFNEDVISSDFDEMKERKFDQIWTLEKGYFGNDARFKIPHRAAAGYPYGYLMAINKSDLHDLCFFLYDSFKFILHLPNEIPTLLHDSDHIDFNTGVILKISAKSTKSESFLRKYSPEKRGCFFEGERSLKFFKAYTKNNCDFECLTNFTLKRCGCVAFFHPRTKSTEICDLDRAACSRNALTLWPHMDEMSNSSIAPCNCFPPCSNIIYHVKKKKVAEIGVNSSLFLIQKLVKEHNNSQIYSGINIEFGDFLIKENLNYIEYKLENLIADCGGLFGLFLGFSFTTVISLIHRFLKNDKHFQTHPKITKVASAPRASSWIANIDNHNDLNNLLIWQMQARDRAFHHRTNNGKLNV